MPAPRLIITVYGTPAPQGSKRHVGNGVMIESSKKVAPWREDVRQAALKAVTEQPSWPTTAPFIVMRAVFVLARPKSHYKTGASTRHLLRDNAPAFVGIKPDLDKLLRSTGDALTSAGAYTDDSRVVSIIARKVYLNTSPPLAAVGMHIPGAHIVLEACT